MKIEGRGLGKREDFHASKEFRKQTFSVLTQLTGEPANRLGGRGGGEVDSMKFESITQYGKEADLNKKINQVFS